MFKPRRVIFEKKSLEYELGKSLLEYFKKDNKIEIIILNNNRINKNIPGDDVYTKYREGKKTLVVGVHKTLKFQTCKPSAHYQLPLISGCMGLCEYCYLNTRLSQRPFLKINVNIDEILEKTKLYIKERQPDITIFEGSATSDPVSVEPYCNSLEKFVKFFAEEEYGRFRFVTKYDDVDNFLKLKHNNHTEIRFSINTDYVIDNYEHYTASRDKRLNAAVKLIKYGYPVGFLIAPVFLYEGWKEDYYKLMYDLSIKLPNDIEHPITFEVISHRYTQTAKNVINEIFPDNNLPMNDSKRTFRYGQFGYGKYVYSKEQIKEIKDFFELELNKLFKDKKILYII